MYRKFMKTFVLASATLFVAAPLALAAESLAKPGPKTMQDVGATQGQDEIVTHGPKPTESSRDTTIKSPASAVSEAPTTRQDVGATQGKEDIVTHGPKPAETARDTSTWPSTSQGRKTMQDVGATQGQSDIVTHGPPPSSSR